jgi:molybdopterin synthase sulfur carrier subunit
MIRVTLPPHLRTLVHSDSEVEINIEGRVTQRAILDALEAKYPVLRGTIREYGTGRRREFLRFFACGEDLSHEEMDAETPDAVAEGKEAFMIVGAIAGG